MNDSLWAKIYIFKDSRHRPVVLFMYWKHLIHFRARSHNHPSRFMILMCSACFLGL